MINLALSQRSPLPAFSARSLVAARESIALGPCTGALRTSLRSNSGMVGVD